LWIDAGGVLRGVTWAAVRTQ